MSRSGRTSSTSSTTRLGLRVQGLGFRVLGLGFRVEGVRSEPISPFWKLFMADNRCALERFGLRASQKTATRSLHLSYTSILLWRVCHGYPKP